MKLTANKTNKMGKIEGFDKKKAVELSIELWEWLAKTGEMKDNWPEWNRYSEVESDCFLCEYSIRGCSKCPYYKKFGFCDDLDKPYDNWTFVWETRDLKKYAKQFLEQLKTILKEMGEK